MTIRDIEYLEKFYSELKSTIEYSRKKLKNNSVLLTLLEVKSNSRYRFINDAALNKYGIGTEIILHLEEKNFIKPIKEVDKYVITVKGIWEYENSIMVLNKELLIDYISSKYFDFYENNVELSNKEKIILFSMISARTFSEKSPIDLRKDDITNDKWREILEKSYEILYSLKVIKKYPINILREKEGNEHPVSNFIRHSDALPKKTKGIFIASGKQKYYLDLYNNSRIDEEKLSYLIWLIVNSNKELLFSDALKLDKYCEYIAYKYNISVFDIEDHLFSKPEYDKIIKDCIIKGVSTKSKWRK